MTTIIQITFGRVENSFIEEDHFPIDHERRRFKEKKGFQPMILRTSPRGIFIQILCLWLLVVSRTTISASEGEGVDCETETCANPDMVQPEKPKIRLVTREEIATKNGVDEERIWISIVGEVYDVTEGTDFYGPGQGYASFAGKDASVAFCTGKFTPEEAQKGPEVLQESELPGLLDWINFYRNHQVYKFIGRLIDPRYYSEEGEPMEAMFVLQKRMQVAMVEFEKKQIEKEKRKQERLKKKRAKKAGVQL